MGDELPPGWVAKVSRSKNATYYWHEATQTSTWDRPEAIVLGASHLLVKHNRSRNPSSWKQVDTGLSKVEIFNNPATNQYRVVGVSYKNNAFVINSQIFKQTVYTQASATFHQWADSQHMYGLNFASLKDAEVRRRLSSSSVLRVVS